MADRLLLEYPTKILLEDGTSALLLEDGTLLLNEASAVAATDAAQLEDASGVVLLEGIPPIDLTGLSTGQSATSATIRARMRFVGTSAAHSAQTSKIRSRIRFVATSAAHSTTSAAIRVRNRFSGLSIAHSTAVGTITSAGVILLTGSSAVHSGTTGAIRIRYRMVGLSSAHSTTSAVSAPAVPVAPATRGGGHRINPWRRQSDARPPGRIVNMGSVTSKARSTTHAEMQVDNAKYRISEIARFQKELEVIAKKVADDELELIAAAIILMEAA
jgi:hypothetical protein